MDVDATRDWLTGASTILRIGPMHQQNYETKTRAGSSASVSDDVRILQGDLRRTRPSKILDQAR